MYTTPHRPTVIKRMKAYINAHAPLSTEANDIRFQKQNTPSEVREEAKAKLKDQEANTPRWEKNMVKMTQLPPRTVHLAVNQMLDIMEVELAKGDGSILLGNFGTFRRQKNPDPRSAHRYRIVFRPSEFL